MYLDDQVKSPLLTKRYLLFLIIWIYVNLLSILIVFIWVKNPIFGEI